MRISFSHPNFSDPDEFEEMRERQIGKMLPLDVGGEVVAEVLVLDLRLEDGRLFVEVDTQSDDPLHPANLLIRSGRF